MASTDTSLTPNTARSRPPRSTPGPPAEVWFWCILPKAKKGRGEHRTLTDNVQYDGWQNIWTRRPPAPGRYRIEFRDARRAIVRVEYVNVPDPRSGAVPYFTHGRIRRPQRKIPPASPAWEAEGATPGATLEPLHARPLDPARALGHRNVRDHLPASASARRRPRRA
jgi:hypothetical protein